MNVNSVVNLSADDQVGDVVDLPIVAARLGAYT